MDLPVRGLKKVDDFLAAKDFFKSNLSCRYEILNGFLQAGLTESFKACQELTADTVYDIFRKNFGGYLGKHDILLAALYAYVFNQGKVSDEQQKKFAPIFANPNLDPPAISMIIPMHNDEKYIGKCLSSLLAQTFKDFEVIVIDAGSADSSFAIVKECAEKFNGRLTLVQSTQNLKYADFPRNKGIELARGEYLSFIETDDTLAPTVLDELYSEAKKFDAQVVHCRKYYFIPDDASAYKEKKFITQPTLLTNDLEKRIKDFSQKWSQWISCLQLIRRDFLVDNGIRFVNLSAKDMVFTMCELCCAENYLLLPNAFYNWRQRRVFSSQEETDSSRTLQKHAQILKQEINYLDEFLNRQELFATRTDLKYALFDALLAANLRRLDDIYQKVPAHELCELLSKEFDGAFSAFLFNAMNIYRLQLNPPQESIDAPTLEILPAIDAEQDFVPEKFPAISVIIPLFNVDKYVGECLDSLLNQTFQNFEVIVIDDCSTDNSRAVVESYAPKFNGRLTLLRSEKNSDYAGFLRNKGIDFAQGEYLSFLYPYDTLAPTAFEELYQAAKKFNADVVHCEKCYKIPDEFYQDDDYRKNLKPSSLPTGDKKFVTQPSLLTNDLEKRVKDFSKLWLSWNVCLQFVRRDFLIGNGIHFSNIYAEDMIFTFCELCCAKNYLVVPNVLYFYRLREDAEVKETFDVLQENPDVPKIIQKYAAALKQGINFLDDFLNRQEFLTERADLKYVLLDTLFTAVLRRLDQTYRHSTIKKIRFSENFFYGIPFQRDECLSLASETGAETRFRT